MFPKRPSSQISLTPRRSLLPHYPRTQPHRTTHTVINLTAKEKKEQAIDFERQILNPERSENSKTGSDDEVGNHKCSYDPSNTRPESEYLADEEECKLAGNGRHPLFVSPANREVSHFLDPMVGGAVHGADRLGPSAQGWTRKNREVHIKDVPGSQYERYEKLLRELRTKNVKPRCVLSVSVS
ncbi:hypothetical protein BDV28DRAFT_148090 [Aspergillus coremiiformis]|uniref:Uncharacterized protein n=1 Tax=Aspergillus coremiiformis TaxID=138285 RepID=A0A5N6Z6Y7_9EURO|nr:hypothetical protein BDV28DRAFT_148090 [Aspergillus coremiiformis]